MSDQAAAPGAPERPRSALAEIRKNPGRRPAYHGHDGRGHRVRRAALDREALPGAEPVDGADAARRRPHPGGALPLPLRRSRAAATSSSSTPTGAGDDVFQTDHASSQNYVKRLIGMPGEWVGSSGGKVYVCETQRAGERPGADGHAGLPLPQGVVHDVADRSVQQHDGRLRPAPPRQGSVPDARRQPAVLRGLALLGRSSTARRSSGARSRSTGRRRASRASDRPGACLTRSPPPGSVHDAAAAGSRARARRHRPLGRARLAERSTRELDAWRRTSPQTLAGYGLEAELVPSPAGLHVHAALDGPRARARRAALPPRHRLPARHRSRGDPCDARASALLGPGTADMKGGLAVARARGAPAGGRRASVRAARARVACPTRRCAPSRSPRRRGWRGSTPCSAWSAAGPAARSSRRARAAAGSTSSRTAARRTRAPSPSTDATPCWRWRASSPRIAALDRRARGPHAARHAHARRRRAQLDSRRGARDDRHARLARRRPRLGRGAAPALRPAPRRDLHDGGPARSPRRSSAPPAVAALAARGGRARRRPGRSRCRRPRPAASPTAAGRPVRACPRWTASGRSARSTTRRTSTSRSHRCAPRCGIVAGLVAVDRRRPARHGA